MVTYKKLGVADVEDFWKLLNALDHETNYMMYEPKEREQRTNIQELKDDIQSNVIKYLKVLYIHYVKCYNKHMYKEFVQISWYL